MSGTPSEAGVMMGAADELRRASERLRGLVNALDPWEGESAEEAGYETWADRYGVKPSYSAPDRAEQGFISTMHPGVGLALADWLEIEAGWAESDEHSTYALDVARLINGGAE